MAPRAIFVYNLLVFFFFQKNTISEIGQSDQAHWMCFAYAPLLPQKQCILAAAFLRENAGCLIFLEIKLWFPQGGLLL